MCCFRQMADNEVYWDRDIAESTFPRRCPLSHVEDGAGCQYEASSETAYRRHLVVHRQRRLRIETSVNRLWFRETLIPMSAEEAQRRHAAVSSRRAGQPAIETLHLRHLDDIVSAVLYSVRLHISHPWQRLDLIVLAAPHRSRPHVPHRQNCNPAALYSSRFYIITTASHRSCRLVITTSAVRHSIRHAGARVRAALRSCRPLVMSSTFQSVEPRLCHRRMPGLRATCHPVGGRPCLATTTGVLPFPARHRRRVHEYRRAVAGVVRHDDATDFRRSPRPCGGSTSGEPAACHRRSSG